MANHFPRYRAMRQFQCNSLSLVLASVTNFLITSGAGKGPVEIYAGKEFWSRLRRVDINTPPLLHLGCF